MNADTQRTAGIPDDELEQNFRLPKRCRDALDADGVVRGKTWRDFLGKRSTITNCILMWWFWRHQIPPEPEVSLEGDPTP